MTNNSGRSGIELGLVLPFHVPPRDLPDVVRIADEGGIDSIWVTDRTISPGRIEWYEPLSLLGTLAGLTTRAKIGTSVLVPARLNPVVTAHSLSTAQEISGGRVVAGIGIGGLEPKDFELCGVDVRQRAPMTDEWVNLMRRLWTEDSVSFTGDHYQCEDVFIPTRPATPPPIWIGGGTPGAMNRAARIGDGWLSIFVPPEAFAGAWAGVQAQAADAGRDPASITPAAYVFSAIADSDEEAKEKLRPHVENLMGAPFDAVSVACLWGTPDTWAERVGAYAEAGVVALNTVLFSDDLVKDTRLLTEEVVPRISTREVAQ
jgi:probable F420-dependent oxidoreductase